ncbi:MAG: biotin--[Clostridia bacterium]|nr:biotin--[acetyl-CoA-carboxylase] ligase [Clostridia bacterium]
DLQNKLTARVIDNFFNNYENKDFLNEYKKRNIVLGNNILVLKNKEQINAKAIEIDDKCRLKVEYSDGNQEYLSTGEISIKLKEL